MMARANPYSAAKIKAGLLHFLLGKAFSSVALILYFILLVRLLTIDEFAAYTILGGLVDVVGSITSVGLLHILLRFVPELYAAHHHSALRSLLWRLFTGRVAVLMISLVLMFATTAWLAPGIGLANWQAEFKLYLPLILIRSVSTVLFMTLESMLHQSSAQTSTTLTAAVRLAGLALAAYLGRVDLQTVLLLEIAADLIGCIVMLMAFRNLLPRSNETERLTGAAWLKDNSHRMLDFGAKAYLQSMLILPTGGSTDRLLVGARLPSVDVALFGLGQWVYDLMQRFLPAQLFQGLMRPIMNARFSKHKEFDEIVMLSNVVLKINLILIGVTAVAFCAGAGPFITTLTGGKYGITALPLILLMCALIAFTSWRHVLDQVSHTVERNEALIWANAVYLLSVIPGVLALPVVGVYALPMSHVIGAVTGNFVMLWELKRAGYAFRHDISSITLISCLSLLCCAWGSALSRTHLHWIAAMAIAVLSFVIVIALNYVAKPSELKLLRSVLGPGQPQAKGA